MRVLCLCQGGNVRSVALAFVLKYEYSEDALAASLEKNSPETLASMMEWAEKIFVVERWMLDWISKMHRDRVTVLEIGPDRWGNSLHPELVALCQSLLVAHRKEANDGSSSRAC